MKKNRAAFSWAGAIGASIWLLFGALAISGVALGTRYSSAIESSHESVVAIKAHSVFSVLHDFHYFGSGLAIILGTINVALLLWCGRFVREDRWLWWGAVGTLSLAMFFQMTGNLLPMSQHDARTAFAEAGIGAQAPLIGSAIREYVLAGDSVSQATLDRWYFAHRIVGPILLLLIALPCIRALKKEIGSRGWLLSTVPILVGIALAFSFDTSLGISAQESDLSTGATQPMWYVLPMHAMLSYVNGINPSLGWVGSMLIPKLALLAMLSLPFLFTKSPARFWMGKALVIAGAGLLTLSLIGYGDKVQSPFAVEPSFEVPSPSTDGESQAVDDALAAVGRRMFEQNQCLSCHAVGGEIGGTAGPNLAGVANKRPEVGWFIQLLRDPESLGITTMPSYSKLSESEIRALAEYLRSLR